MIRIPAKAEAQHMQFIGDTGAGKSALMFQVLRQVQSRGDSAIVYDPAREYVRRFSQPGTRRRNPQSLWTSAARIGDQRRVA